MLSNDELDRRFKIAASQPLNRRERRDLLKEAKRARYSTKDKKALVALPLDLGIRSFKKAGPKKLRSQYKVYAHGEHAKRTQPSGDTDKKQ